jgi:hypothetical protein
MSAARAARVFLRMRNEITPHCGQFCAKRVASFGGARFAEHALTFVSRLNIADTGAR